MVGCLELFPKFQAFLFRLLFFRGLSFRFWQSRRNVYKFRRHGHNSVSFIEIVIRFGAQNGFLCFYLWVLRLPFISQTNFWQPPSLLHFYLIFVCAFRQICGSNATCNGYEKRLVEWIQCKLSVICLWLEVSSLRTMRNNVTCVFPVQTSIRFV